MARYLLDTNHLSPLITLEHPLRIKVLQQLRAGDEFVVSVVVLAEFLYGILSLPRATTNITEWRHFQNSFGYYTIDIDDAEEAAKLQVLMRRRGRQVATIDALIAVTAIRHQLTLLTTDRDFDFIPNLQRENWLLV